MKTKQNEVVVEEALLGRLEKSQVDRRQGQRLGIGAHPLGFWPHESTAANQHGFVILYSSDCYCRRNMEKMIVYVAGVGELLCKEAVQTIKEVWESIVEDTDIPKRGPWNQQGKLVKQSPLPETGCFDGITGPVYDVEMVVRPQRNEVLENISLHFGQFCPNL